MRRLSPPQRDMHVRRADPRERPDLLTVLPTLHATYQRAKLRRLGPLRRDGVRPTRARDGLEPANALAKDPALRYRDVAEFALELVRGRSRAVSSG